MRHIKLIREPDVHEDGTFGTLSVDDCLYSTVERPWLGNQPRISCIPEGIYTCTLTNSSTNRAAGMAVAYEVLDVRDRDLIKIHVANWPTDVLGCIGLGTHEAIGTDGRRMVVSSKEAIMEFYKSMGGEDFILEIVRGKK